MIDHNAFSGLDVDYDDAFENAVRAVHLYVNASKLYPDAAHENQIGHDLALELCEKGVARVFDTDTFYNVVSFKDATGTLTIGYDAKTVTVTDPSL